MKYSIVARKIIKKATESWLSENQLIWDDLYKISENDRVSLIEQIDRAYPFGIRKYWPYKVWLRERKAFIKINLADKQEKQKFTSLPLFENFT